MKLNTKNFVGRLRLLVLLLMLILVASACDFPSSSDNDEPITFEDPPIVRIETPLNGDNYQEGVGVNIQARIENAGPDITRISISVDGAIIGEQTSPNPNGAASFTVNTGWPATGIGQHTISISANRGNGMVSNPESVTINVVAAPNASESQQDSPTTASQEEPTADTGFQEPTQDNSAQQVAPTNTFVPPPPTVASTNPPAVTNTSVPPTTVPTLSRPQIRVITGANVRSGPGIVFAPPVGSLAANSLANILAVNPAGTWYKIQYYAGEAWISAQVVEVTGDISSLPRDAGPATPVPATNTPVPTATSNSQVDLVITLASTHPEFYCGQASEIQVTIVNIGTSNSAATEVIVRDIYNGEIQEETNAHVPALAPNEQHVAILYLTVSTYVHEGHTSRIIVDPNNTVPELNEGNNTSESTYVLDC